MSSVEISQNKLEFSQFRLETVTMLRLGAHWENTLLSGHHWRLYHHKEAGVSLLDRGRRIPLLPNKIYLLPPFCELRGSCEGEPVQLFLHFNASGFTGNPQYLCNEVDVDEALAKNLEIIYSELARKRADGGRLMLAAMSLASSAMLALPADAATELKSDETISMLCERMRIELNVDWNISKLTRIAKLPEKKLLEKFRETTNSTPFQYLLHLRYARAARLLQASDFTIDEICEHIGINDRFHFSRRFKRLYGLPPATYRKYYKG